MLNTHSSICVPPELQILHEESGNARRLFAIFKSGEQVDFVADDYIRLIEECCPYRIHEYFDLKEFFKVRDYPEKDLGQLAIDLFTAIAHSKGKSYFIEQTPWYGQHIRALSRLFPGAKVIHLIRDGRDVALSFARTPWWSHDVIENLRRWEREASVILRDSSEVLKPEQVFLVRYEDLVHEPERVTKEICCFLGVEFESGMLDPSKYIRYESLQKGNLEWTSSQAQHRWERDSKKPTFTDSVQAWKTHGEVDFGEAGEKVEELLFRLGYESNITSVKCPHGQGITANIAGKTI